MNTGKMKAVVIKKPGEIELVEKEIPRLNKGEALLKIKYCGICGSDVATYTGNQPFATYPRIPGHEFSAEVVEVAEEDSPIKPGMIVTANPYFNCKKCYSCRRGKVNCCEDNQTMGVQRDGAFCEYVAMPVERIFTGNGIDAPILALVEPFSIGYHAIKRGNVKKGDNLLVIGAGPIGIFAAISAKMAGARVYVADMLEKRLSIALGMGADGVINTGRQDLRDEVRLISNGSGMDVCVEAVGIPETFLSCIDHVCFGGKVILIGNGTRETTFNHSVILKKELDIYGSRNSLNDFKPLIDVISKKIIDIGGIVSNVFDISEAAEAFEALKNNDGSIAKVLIKF